MSIQIDKINRLLSHPPKLIKFVWQGKEIKHERPARTTIFQDQLTSSEGYKKKDIHAVEGIEDLPEYRPKPKRTRTKLFDD